MADLKVPEVLNIRFQKTWKDYIWLYILLGFFLISIISNVFLAPPLDGFVFYDDQFQEQYASEVEGAKVGLLFLNGIILPDTSSDVFAFAESVITPGYVWQNLQILQEHEDLSALLVVLSSPGGAVTSSDEIAHLFQKLQEKIPVFVYTPDLMASGGYYISAYAEKIFAHRQAEIGSIGVIVQIPNISSLVDSIGFELEVYSSGDLKDLGNPLRPRTEQEKEIFQGLVDEAFQDFKTVIQEGRSMSVGAVEAVATGEVWTGRKAVENGLIDATLYMDELSSTLATELGVEQVHYVEYLPPIPFIDQILSTSIVKSDPILASISRIIPTLPKGVYYLWY